MAALALSARTLTDSNRRLLLHSFPHCPLLREVLSCILRPSHSQPHTVYRLLNLGCGQRAIEILESSNFHCNVLILMWFYSLSCIIIYSLFFFYFFSFLSLKLLSVQVYRLSLQFVRVDCLYTRSVQFYRLKLHEFFPRLLNVPM